MPPTSFDFEDQYTYLNGFGCHHESETLPGSLPVGMESPQQPAYGLYAEKFSGTAFTAPRHENQQFGYTASCQLQPTVLGNRCQQGSTLSTTGSVGFISVEETRDPVVKSGLAIFVFAAGKDIDEHEAFYSADGGMLIVPQHGVLNSTTEFGRISLRANEICVIPRGVRYRVSLPGGPVRGYICELYQANFQLPELGPIGSNGLANARDFQAPTAHYSKDASTWKVISKFNKRLFRMTQDHTPFDVVAWHGIITPTSMT
ncbi:hypothetical protein LTR36_003002 [Oleoguttula mirabilis]|uniref:homogentisate 1,2-dioxygenase n=1 Tax=Oleoguttula mirabilis TaxID=1507867 RepID=A0AAV9JWW0_9PEZI|nr:hypothetical protein LTR36_003002 [Oleoguttula mirabilis]